MVLTTDAGQKARCANPRCQGVIKHGENVGIVDDGKNLWHSDCWRDRFGPEAAQDTKWLQEQGRDVRRQRTLRWANFDRQPAGAYGARRVA
jgi:hypothetical protein